MPLKGTRKKRHSRPLSKDSSTVECVELQPSDAEKLYEFYSSLPVAVTRVFRPFGRPTLEVMRKHLDEAKAGCHISIGLVTSSRIMGHGFVMHIEKKHPVFGLGLVESLHGQGLGRLLMNRVIEKAKERNVTYMTLTVVKRNEKALKLSRSFGFEIATDHPFETESDSYIMRYDGGGSECTG